MKGLSWRVYNASTQRIAEIVGAYPVTIQAADLPQALSTGLINAFMTSSATGYDSKAWERMCYFYPMSNVAEIAPFGGGPGLVAFMCSHCGTTDSVLTCEGHPRRPHTASQDRLRLPA